MFDPTDLWRDYPHIPLAAPVKFYYLTQTAFYIHQVLVLNAEARRKDHAQMMTHHFITVFLMGLSYFYNVTRAGCLIMVLMDWCDIFLPVSTFIISLWRSSVLIPFLVRKNDSLYRVQSAPVRHDLWMVPLFLGGYTTRPISGRHCFDVQGLSETRSP